MQYAEGEFNFTFRDPSTKMTWREELVAKWQATGIEPDEMACHIEPPWCIRYLWKWWNALSAARPPGMEISGLIYSEIDSWSRLTASKIEPWEAQVLFRLDAIFMQARQRQADADSKCKTQHAGNP